MMTLFTIKFAHSLFIIYMMVCLYVVWHYALIGIYHPFIKWALGWGCAEAVGIVSFGV